MRLLGCFVYYVDVSVVQLLYNWHLYLNVWEGLEYNYQVGSYTPVVTFDLVVIL